METLRAQAQTVRAAVAQATPVVFDTPATLDVVADWSIRASEAGAELLVFPEAFIGGYPKGSTFGAVVGDRTTAGRDQFRRYLQAAITVPGPECEQLGAIAQQSGLHLVIGVVERDGGTLYCTVVFFAPTGELLGKRRKLMPTGAERMIWGFGDGSTMNVYPTPIGRLGAVICWENLMPAARLAMYAKGIELYCAPTADGRDSHHATMRHIAQEGRCFVLAANQVTRVRDFPADHFDSQPATTPERVVSRGGSSIIGPLGQVLAGPTYDEEALLIADLDLREIDRAKYDFDAVGHYARPDIFHLSVDESPRSVVTTRTVA